MGCRGGCHYPCFTCCFHGSPHTCRETGGKVPRLVSSSAKWRYCPVLGLRSREDEMRQHTAKRLLHRKRPAEAAPFLDAWASGSVVLLSDSLPQVEGIKLDSNEHLPRPGHSSRPWARWDVRRPGACAVEPGPRPAPPDAALAQSIVELRVEAYTTVHSFLRILMSVVKPN